MTPRKQVTGGATFKGKAKVTTGGTTPKPSNNQLPIEGNASISSQEPTTSSQLSQ